LLDPGFVGAAGPPHPNAVKDCSGRKLGFTQVGEYEKSQTPPIIH
jgi:hypothetical protein